MVALVATARQEAATARRKAASRAVAVEEAASSARVAVAVAAPVASARVTACLLYTSVFREPTPIKRLSIKSSRNKGSHICYAHISDSNQFKTI